MSAGSATVVGRDPGTGRGLRVDIAEGRIAAVVPSDYTGDVFLSAGLVDLQVNGYAGLDLNDGSLAHATVVDLAGRLARAGVTCFAPTLITASEASLCAAMAAIAEARRLSPLVARMVPFIHVEGPSISPEDGPRGAHPLGHVRPPDLGEYRRWQAAAGGLVGLVTLSPEWPGAMDYIAALGREGTIVALGHTAAGPEQIHAAAAAGARLSTHLGNGIAATLPRHPNAIWAQLADDRLKASFIADGHHLPGDALRAMLRAKSLELSILVSDAAALGGMPPGRYGSPIGGEVEVRADGRLGMAGTSYLAGAGHLLNCTVVRAMDLAGLSLAEALRLATANPGALAGGRSRLVPGAPADIIRFRHGAGDAELRIEETFIAGERIEA